MTAPVATARALAATTSRLSCMQAITRLWFSRLGVVHNTLQHRAAQGTAAAETTESTGGAVGPGTDACRTYVNAGGVVCPLLPDANAHLTQSKVGPADQQPFNTYHIGCSTCWLSSVHVVPNGLLPYPKEQVFPAQTTYILS